MVIGGSYAGAMSAWFRYKYPHLAVGSIASSAVVYAVADFPEFENQTVKNLKKCEGEPVGWAVQLLRSYQVYADSQLFSSNPEDTKTFLSMFNATDMTYMDFAYYFADLPVAYTQSGLRRRLLCPILADLKKSGLPVKEQVKKFADTTAAYGFTAEKYKFARLQNITIDFAKSSRQWYYQVCTAFGWLQSSYAANPIRWTGMNLTYWYRYCHKAYNDIILPDDIRTNVYTSGDMLGKFATNTYFSNGQDDGWQYASLTDNEYNNQRIVVKMINCDDCAHCMDLKTSNDNDPQELKDTRAEEIKKMLEWFGTAQ